MKINTQLSVRTKRDDGTDPDKVLTILLGDGCAVNRKLIKAILKTSLANSDFKYIKFEEFESGRQLVDRVTNEHESEDKTSSNIRLIILNTLLSEMDGVKAAGQIRKSEEKNRINGSSSKIIITNSTIYDGYTAEELSHADGMLIKPFGPNDFKEVVSSISAPRLEVDTTFQLVEEHNEVKELQA